MLDEFKKVFESDDGLLRKLEHLERNLMFFSDPDQRTILSYRLAFDTGNTLSGAHEQEINRLLQLLAHSNPQVSGEMPSISPAKVVLDLVRVMQTFEPNEKAAFHALALKVQNRQPLSVEETEALFKLYARKGFK